MDSILSITLVGCWQHLDLFLWMVEAEKVRKKRQKKYVHPDDQTQPTFDKPLCYFQHLYEEK